MSALNYTPADVACLLAKARRHKMTPAERREQRISLIMGLRSSRSTLTREQVDAFMRERGE